MDKNEEMKLVHQYLVNLFGCTEDDLYKDDIIFTINNQIEQSYIKILTYRKCIVVNVSSSLYNPVKSMLSGKNRDEIFELPLVYGQTIHYIPDMRTINELELPKEYTYELLKGEEINSLAHVQGFDNSLVFDDMGKTSTKLVFVAKKDNEVVGVAGVGQVTEKMWEVGIDVRPECRNSGLGSVLTRMLTLEILKKGVVPFYSASVTNIGSQMVANRAGYIPCWMDTFGNIFDQYYAYNYEDVIMLIKETINGLI